MSDSTLSISTLSVSTLSASTLSDVIISWFILPVKVFFKIFIIKIARPSCRELIHGKWIYNRHSTIFFSKENSQDFNVSTVVSTFIDIN